MIKDMDRYNDMVVMRQAGETYAFIAKKYNITRGRVKQIVGHIVKGNKYSSVIDEMRNMREMGKGCKEIADYFGIAADKVYNMVGDINLVLDKWFWSNVDIKDESDCWNWKGCCHNVTGYGAIRRKPIRNGYSHRLAWELSFGKIPEDKVLRHTCDNPKCCNPNHLLLGTQAENVQDREDRYKGASRNTRKLSYDIAKEIREMRNIGYTYNELAKKYKVAWGTVFGICKYKYYK